MRFDLSRFRRLVKTPLPDAFDCFTDSEWGEFLEMAEELGKMQPLRPTPISEIEHPPRGWVNNLVAVVPEETDGHSLPERMVDYMLTRAGKEVMTVRLPDNMGAADVRAAAIEQYQASSAPDAPGQRPPMMPALISAAEVRVIRVGSNGHSVFFKSYSDRFIEATRPPVPRILAHFKTFIGRDRPERFEEFDVTDLVVAALKDHGHAPMDGSAEVTAYASDFLLAAAPAWVREWREGYSILVEESMKTYLTQTGQPHLLEAETEDESRDGERSMG